MPLIETFHGVDDAALAYFLVQQRWEQQGAVCFVGRSAEQVAPVARELAFFDAQARVVVFPAWDVQPYDRVAPAVEVQAQRVAAIQALQAGGADYILTTVNGAGTRFLPEVPEALTLRVGEVRNPTQLAAALVGLGMTRVETVTDVGLF